MPFRSMEQGIAAIQAGNLEEGARLLRYALKSDVITGSLRATAYLWLAETSRDPGFKRDCYDHALVADPDNEDIRQRLAALMAAPPQPVPTTAPVPQTTPPQTSVSTAQSTATQPIVGIIGGPNGLATGFFVTRDGLLATTRYAIGGLEQIRIELAPGVQQPGRIVRSYSQLDLALIHVGQNVTNLPPVTPTPRIPDEARLTAVTYSGEKIAFTLRATKRILAPHWFPTDITETAFADAGGNPVFDERGYLVGMLTKNISRASGYVHGVHIAAIYKAVESFSQEVHANRSRVYCPCCGYLSQAAAAGGYYCERCGAVMPQAQQITRHPLSPQIRVYYEEPGEITCPHCHTMAGIYNLHCLRCGREIGPVAQ